MLLREEVWGGCSATVCIRGGEVFQHVELYLLNEDCNTGYDYPIILCVDHFTTRERYIHHKSGLHHERLYPLIYTPFPRRGDFACIYQVILPIIMIIAYHLELPHIYYPFKRRVDNVSFFSGDGYQC